MWQSLVAAGRGHLGPSSRKPATISSIVPRNSPRSPWSSCPDTISFFKNDIPATFEGRRHRTAAGAFSSDQGAACTSPPSRTIRTGSKNERPGLTRMGIFASAPGPHSLEAADTMRWWMYPSIACLAIGLANMLANQEVVSAGGPPVGPAQIAPGHMLADLNKMHPARRTSFLDTFRKTLVGLKAFIESHHLLTIPSPVMPILEETPPFDRALTMASMDIPGPCRRQA